MNLPVSKDNPWVAVVANPFSGAGPNQQLVARLTKALEEHGLPHRVLWDPRQRTEVLQDPRWQASCKCIVVAGGDGTVGGVINETCAIPIAVLPMGNENLFGRQFKFWKPERIAAAVARGRLRAVDLGSVDDRLFCVMATVGLDADVVDRVTRWRVRGEKLRRVTRLSYTKPILDSVLRYKYPPVELVADGRVYRGAHAMVFNMDQYATGLHFTPDALHDDGRLHWVVFEKPGMLRGLWYFANVFMRSRHLALPDVHVGSAETIELRTVDGNDAPVQVDGDPAARTPVTVRVVPRALRVVEM